MIVADTGSTGFEPAGLDRAYRLLTEWTRSGEVPAAALCVGRHGKTSDAMLFGRMGTEPDVAPIRPDARFLVASIAKPITVAAALILVERGALTLDDRVVDFLPEFGQNGKGEVRIRHLMTHTSGLPDMPPNNQALRAVHAPLSRFIEVVARLPLAFPPGTQVSYQSMGTAILGEVVQKVTGIGLASFLEAEVFGPLGMSATSLGCPPEFQDRVAAVRLPGEQVGTDWNWNSPYWLGLGAPWGGLVTTAQDLARFCQMMLGDGTLEGVRVLGAATVRAMTSNQIAGMPGVPEAERRCRPWGLGWRLNWPGHSANFGDLLGPRTFGHWGASGTLLWVDPDADAFLVLLTTQPDGDAGTHLARISNIVAAALV